jgi:hypothetical protein
MANLTIKQQSFIALMSKSEEHARRGFQLLLKRDDCAHFFDALAERGLFAPEQNPAPVVVDQQGSVRLPYWAALDYLAACAAHAAATSDESLGTKVLAIVRSVTAFKDVNGVRDNYHTFRKFAEILGQLPLAIVTDEDIDLVAVWISSRYDRDGIAHALDEGLMKRLLESDEAMRHQQATRLFDRCLTLGWQRSSRTGEEEEPVSVVEGYWLQELVSHHARTCGRRAGRHAAEMFARKVRQVFGKGGRAEWSWSFRPAVESHSQNRAWHSVENAVVEGLRDALLGWGEADTQHFEDFVVDLIRADVEMLRRVGIFIMNEQWSVCGHRYTSVVSRELFDEGHVHELSHLLERRFDDFDQADKDGTLAAIRAIKITDGEDATARSLRAHLRWLSALVTSTYAPVQVWIRELTATLKTSIPQNADFNSYIESSVGPGPSPYAVEELAALAERGCIVEKLNEVKPAKAWREPSIEALVDALERAVGAAPQHFVRALPKFADAASPYQEAIVNGFRRLWLAPAPDVGAVDWDETWHGLMNLVGSVCAKGDTTVRVEDGVVYTFSRFATAAADLLHAGTRDDTRSYPEALLPQAWPILESLCDRAQAVESPADDSMFQAINSPRGRVIEALFSQLLRECRIADRKSDGHAQVWASRRGRIDAELARAEAANYEFLTLAAAYGANLDYVDPQWFEASVPRIFPLERPVQLLCALGGLAYCAMTRRVYVLLRNAGVLDRALPLELKGRDSRKMLVERIVLGYLWNEESLDSPRIGYLFEGDRDGDLKAAIWFLWTVRRQELTSAQIEKIGDFGEKMCGVGKSTTSAPGRNTIRTRQSHLDNRGSGWAQSRTPAGRRAACEGSSQYSPVPR